MSHEPANMNIDLENASTRFLDSHLPTYSQEQLAVVTEFSGRIVYAIMQLCIKQLNKFAKHHKDEYILCLSAVSIGVYNLAIMLSQEVIKRNPMAGEALKRHLQETMLK